MLKPSAEDTLLGSIAGGFFAASLLVLVREAPLASLWQCQHRATSPLYVACA